MWFLQGVMEGKIRIVVNCMTHFAPLQHSRRNTPRRNSGAAAVDCEFPNSFLVPGWIITLVSGTVLCIKKAPAHQKGSFDRRFGSSDRTW